MNYNPALENFIDFVDFTKNDPCIWVVYPPGCGGDLLSALLSKHYFNPGAEFYGIQENGKVVFHDSNYKHFNLNQGIINDEIFQTISKHLSDKNLNYSLVDQIFFSNHGYTQQKINEILDFFIQAKIIRILPKNQLEYKIVKWLANFKNYDKVADFLVEPEDYDITNNFKIYPEINNQRVLTIGFSDLLNEDKFELAYDKIIDFLNLPYKLIRHDFIKFWISKQHPTIRHYLEKLTISNG